MRRLHIILPMAGRGSRFTKAGVKTPKPLIIVDDQPMFLKALSSLKAIDAPKTYTLIIRKEHDEKYGLRKLLNKELPEANIVITDAEPIGAATDALRAEQYIMPNDAVIVMDCDLWFQSESYNQMVEEVLQNQADNAGGLLTFEADNPRYSYAKLGNDNLVIETAEKRVISNRAITGAYFFSTAQTFIETTKKLMEKPITPEMPEYYMSLLYNILIDEGKKIRAAFVDDFASFGTPEELADYQAGKSV